LRVVFDVLLIVALPILVAVAVAWRVGRRKSVSDGASDSDSVSFIGGAIGALFSVVLAFFIVFAWQLGADISNNSSTESDALIDAYRQAQYMPEPDRSALQEHLRDYATRVASTEWGLLAQGRVDERPAEIIRTVRATFAGMAVTDTVTQSIRENGLSDMRLVDQSHRARVDLSTGSNAFNGVLLGGTIIGAVLMLLYPLVVGMSARPANLVVLAILTFMVGATVFLSIQLTHPLDGMFGVGPDAFTAALDEMQLPT
jgi:hypothetical protein